MFYNFLLSILLISLFFYSIWLNKWNYFFFYVLLVIFVVFVLYWVFFFLNFTIEFSFKDGSTILDHLRLIEANRIRFSKLLSEYSKKDSLAVTYYLRSFESNRFDLGELNSLRSLPIDKAYFGQLITQNHFNLSDEVYKGLLIDFFSDFSTKEIMVMIDYGVCGYPLNDTETFIYYEGFSSNFDKYVNRSNLNAAFDRLPDADAKALLESQYHHFVLLNSEMQHPLDFFMKVILNPCDYDLQSFKNYLTPAQKKMLVLNYVVNNLEELLVLYFEIEQE